MEKNPRSVEALNWRGMAYDDLGKLDAALADLNKAIQLSPKYADAYNNRGEVHRKKKMYPQALSDYRKAASLDKKLAEPHYNIALIYESQKKNRDAATEFSKYMALKPKAEDKKEIENKIKSLGQAKKVRKTRRPAPKATRAAKPGKQPDKKPGERPRSQSWKKKAPAKTSAAAVEVPGMGKIDAPPEAAAALAMLAGLGIVALAIPLIIYIFFAVMLFLIARKTGTSLPWLAFITHSTTLPDDHDRGKTHLVARSSAPPGSFATVRHAGCHGLHGRNAGCGTWRNRRFGGHCRLPVHLSGNSFRTRQVGDMGHP